MASPFNSTDSTIVICLQRIEQPLVDLVTALFTHRHQRPEIQITRFAEFITYGNLTITSWTHILTPFPIRFANAFYSSLLLNKLSGIVITPEVEQSTLAEVFQRSAEIQSRVEKAPLKKAPSQEQKDQ